MKVRQAFVNTKNALDAHRIPCSALEAQILIAHAMEVDRSKYYSLLEEELVPSSQVTLEHILERRLMRFPLAYLLERREFYDVTLFVDHRVLIPRQETEVLVEKAIDLAASRPLATIVDVGTGSGAIAIALARHLPNATIYATDISPEALEVAITNVRKHILQDKIMLCCGNLLTFFKISIDIIVANLPYVPSEDMVTLQAEVMQEPIIALDGGYSGLNVITSLVEQAADYLNPRGALLFEIDPRQVKEATVLCQRTFPNGHISVARDLSSLERAIIVELM